MTATKYSVDDLLAEVIHGFYPFMKMYGGEAVIKQYEPLRLLGSRFRRERQHYLTLNFSGCPSESAHVKGRLPKDPAVEQVTVMQLSEDCMSSFPVATYELPLGTLVTIAEKEIDSEIASWSFPEMRNEEDKRDFSELRQILDDIMSREERIDQDHILADFTSFSEIYINDLRVWDNQGLLRQDVVCSLAGIIYSTFVDSGSLFKKGAVAKRCKVCDKIFFARHGNQKYCNYQCPDPLIKNQSCQEAMKTRKRRESDSKIALGKAIASKRNSYALRNDKSVDWYGEFSGGLEEEKAKLVNDLWKYRKLLQWVKDYDNTHPYKRTERSDK